MSDTEVEGVSGATAARASQGSASDSEVTPAIPGLFGDDGKNAESGRHWLRSDERRGIRTAAFYSDSSGRGRPKTKPKDRKVTRSLSRSRGAGAKFHRYGTVNKGNLAGDYKIVDTHELKRTGALPSVSDSRVVVPGGTPGRASAVQSTESPVAVHYLAPSNIDQGQLSKSGPPSVVSDQSGGISSESLEEDSDREIPNTQSDSRGRQTPTPGEPCAIVEVPTEPTGAATEVDLQQHGTPANEGNTDGFTPLEDSKTASPASDQNDDPDASGGTQWDRSNRRHQGDPTVSDSCEEDVQFTPIRVAYEGGDIQPQGTLLRTIRDRHLDTLRNTNDALRRNNEQLANELALCQKHLKTAEHGLLECEAAHAILQGRVQQLTIEKAELSDVYSEDNKRWRQTVESMEEELEKTKVEFQVRLTESQRQEALLQDQNQGLLEELDTYKERLTLSQKRERDLLEEVAKTSSRVARLQKKVDEEQHKRRDVESLLKDAQRVPSAEANSYLSVQANVPKTGRGEGIAAQISAKPPYSKNSHDVTTPGQETPAMSNMYQETALKKYTGGGGDEDPSSPSSSSSSVAEYPSDEDTSCKIKELRESLQVVKMGRARPQDCKLPEFSGKPQQDPVAWWRKLENEFALQNVTYFDVQKALIYRNLSGVAQVWYDTLPDEAHGPLSSLKRLKKAFMKKFAAQETKIAAEHRWEERKMRVGENVDDYMDEVITIGHQLGASETATFKALMRGLLPEIKTAVIRMKPRNLDELVADVRVVNASGDGTGNPVAAAMAAISEVTNVVQELPNAVRKAVKDTVGPREGATLAPPKNESSDLMALVREAVQAAAETRSSTEHKAAKGVKLEPIPITCYQCGQEGHTRKDCKINLEKCYACGAEGHYMKDCPEIKKFQPPIAKKEVRRRPTGGRGGTMRPTQTAAGEKWPPRVPPTQTVYYTPPPAPPMQTWGPNWVPAAPGPYTYTRGDAATFGGWVQQSGPAPQEYVQATSTAPRAIEASTGARGPPPPEGN